MVVGQDQSAGPGLLLDARGDGAHARRQHPAFAGADQFQRRHRFAGPHGLAGDCIAQFLRGAGAVASLDVTGIDRILWPIQQAEGLEPDTSPISALATSTWAVLLAAMATPSGCARFIACWSPLPQANRAEPRSTLLDNCQRVVKRGAHSGTRTPKVAHKCQQTDVRCLARSAEPDGVRIDGQPRLPRRAHRGCRCRACAAAAPTPHPAARGNGTVRTEKNTIAIRRPTNATQSVWANRLFEPIQSPMAAINLASSPPTQPGMNRSLGSSLVPASV